MTELHDLLQRAAPEPRRRVDVAELDRRAARHRTRARALGGLAAALVVATLLTIGLTESGGEEDGRVDTAGNGELLPPEVIDDHDPDRTVTPEVSDDQVPDGTVTPDTEETAPSPEATPDETDPTSTPPDDRPEAAGVDSSRQQAGDTITLTDPEGDTEESPFAAPLTSRQPEPSLDITAAQLKSDPTVGTLTTRMELADLGDTAPPGADGTRYEWRTTLTSPTQTIDLVIEVQRYNGDQYVRFITYSGPDSGEILPCGPGCEANFDAVIDTVSVAVPAPAVERLLSALSIDDGDAVTLAGLSAQTVWVHTTRNASSCDERETRTHCTGPYANAPADNARAAGEPAITLR